ncbi:MAG: alpha/beta hydrolase, partial [Bacteroidota bacterium]
VVTSINQTSKPFLVMVHGAPGGITAFGGYMKDSLLQERFHFINYDRPGYGNDDDPAEPSIGYQADVLQEILGEFCDSTSQIVFLSHSYGGPIAAAATIGLPMDDITHVMVAPVIEPSTERIFWYSSLPLRWPLSLISSHNLKTAAVEKVEHPGQIEQFVDLWPSVQGRTIHVHGTADFLAPVENIDFVKSRFPSSSLESIVLEERSHFILWTRDTHELIRTQLLGLFD